MTLLFFGGTTTRPGAGATVRRGYRRVAGPLASLPSPSRHRALTGSRRGARRRGGAAIARSRWWRVLNLLSARQPPAGLPARRRTDPASRLGRRPASESGQARRRDAGRFGLGLSPARGRHAAATRRRRHAPADGWFLIGSARAWNGGWPGGPAGGRRASRSVMERTCRVSRRNSRSTRSQRSTSRAGEATVCR